MSQLPLAFEINTEWITNFPHLPFLFTSFTMAKVIIVLKAMYYNQILVMVIKTSLYFERNAGMSGNAALSPLSNHYGKQFFKLHIFLQNFTCITH